MRWARHAVFGAPPAPDRPTPDSTAFDWLIVGGESGHGARPFNVRWAREAVAFCRKAGVAAFVKQLGAAAYEEINGGHCGVNDAPLRLKSGKGDDPDEWPADLRVREMPGVPALAAAGWPDARGTAEGRDTTNEKGRDGA